MSAMEKIEKIMKDHELMSLATVSLDGKPRVRSVDFVMGDDASTLYFITNVNTQKVKELEKDSAVFISIDHDCPDMESLAQLSYLKAEGRARMASSPEEGQAIFGRILQKFPHLVNLPGEPSDFTGFEVKLSKIYLTDNSVGFGHTEELSL